MKLLFVVPEWGSVAGGIATYYRHLVPALRDLGHEVDIWVGSPHNAGSSVAAEDPGVRWLDDSVFVARMDEFRHLAPLSGLQQHLAAAWALHDKAATSNYDLVECVDWGLGFLPWMQTDARVVVRLHASLSQIAAREALPGQALFQSFCAALEQCGLALADGLVTYSSLNGGFWRDQLQTAVEVQRPPYAPGRESGRSGRGLVSGRIQRWKGVETLCAALQKTRGLELDWYGRDMPTHVSGRRISMSASLARRFPDVWETALVPRGVVSPRQLDSLRDEAAFAVVPSDWDVFNFTVAESMGAALPSIVSRGAGASELIDHGHNGLLFDSSDSDSLAAALGHYQAMGESGRAAMGNAARQTILDELDPSTVAKTHADYYARIVSRPARTRSGEAVNRLLNCPQSLVDGSADVLENISGRKLVAAFVNRARQRLGGRP